jgi:hypothetical protein
MENILLIKDMFGESPSKSNYEHSSEEVLNVEEEMKMYLNLPSVNCEDENKHFPCILIYNFPGTAEDK